MFIFYIFLNCFRFKIIILLPSFSPRARGSSVTASEANSNYAHSIGICLKFQKKMGVYFADQKLIFEDVRIPLTKVIFEGIQI